MRSGHLFLTGYRGTGKTSVGTILSRRLSLPLIDLDDRVQRAAGKTIHKIFAESGEEYFRDLESQALAEVVIGPRSIISLGGGAVLRDQNRDLIRAHGTCVWLQAEPRTLAARIRSDAASQSQRPALTELSGEEEVREILHRRLPLYEAAADFSVSTERKSLEQVAEEILKATN